ncbi:WD40 repeat domain-containing protein [Psychroserpens ponticola]|uniref:WD40 repeat domain-containing protein n=1 Tax=Psychroserpens ponticola TaxID=2932268 RepID=A0ABY7S0R3_9FLAO|nr:WD40 repeat domain-containing protein [Psychroserpens ponticola]WCO01515.1 WD40 repeat domain-containing protein [Psychroserpens ponticola]
MMKNNSYLVVLFVLFTTLSFAQKGQEETKILWTANWSHDGNYIAIGGDDKTIRIYNGNTFEFIKTYQNESEIKRLSWHPTQNILAVAAVGNHSKLIDLNSDKITKFKDIETSGSRAIEWNYNGEFIALADFDGNLFIMNNKGEHIKTISKEGTFSYVGVDWHPKKNEIITLSEKVRIFNIDGKLLKELKHRIEDVLMLCVKWHPSGEFFVIGDYGDINAPYKPLLQFWKEDGTLISQSSLSKAEYRNVSWNQKGKRLATASDALRIWNQKGTLLHTGLSHTNLWGIDWSPDGNYIVTSSETGYITIWNKNAEIVTRLEK